MDFWKHGKYVDAWSAVHCLSGFLLGGAFYWLGTSFFWSFVFSMLILLLWEGFEAATKIIEPSINVGVDILIGLFGYFLAAYLYYTRGMEFDSSLYLTVLAATAILALWGFVDFLKRGYR